MGFATAIRRYNNAITLETTRSSVTSKDACPGAGLSPTSFEINAGNPLPLSCLSRPPVLVRARPHSLLFLLRGSGCVGGGSVGLALGACAGTFRLFCLLEALLCRRRQLAFQLLLDQTHLWNTRDARMHQWHACLHLQVGASAGRLAKIEEDISTNPISRIRMRQTSIGTSIQTLFLPFLSAGLCACTHAHDK